MSGAIQIFAVGDLVEKIRGYRYPGIVRSAYEMPGGWRYDVEADHPDFAGMLHIFSGEQLGPRAPSLEPGQSIELRQDLRRIKRQCETIAFNLNQRDEPDDEIVRAFLEIAGQAGRAAEGSR